MEAEQVILPNGKTATLAKTHTLTAANDSTVKLFRLRQRKRLFSLSAELQIRKNITFRVRSTISMAPGTFWTRE
ncbi:hypothetical protein [Pseudomonas viridiflava]|uniref:hypothetical protein n=1 Tax=Pseudomonas viridiflava TaxID=33069 RepID=UPI001F11A3A2|nr:hypothetical protein [Pseudomonas viridiflava]